MNEGAVLVDGVDAISSHNGVFRVSFFRLDKAGKPLHAFEMHIPAGAAKGISEAFTKLR